MTDPPPAALILITVLCLAFFLAVFSTFHPRR
jgi:hypothetical protein